MTKFEIEAEEFKKAFSDKKDKRFAIYGTGRFTATLIELVKDFNFIGLLDRDEKLVGSEIYGIKVLSKEQVLKECDLIVINTQSTYWNVIFERIKDWGIPVYYRNGEKAIASEFKNFSDNPYWESSFLDLKEAIKHHDVISFDIFDTLLVRKVFFDIDVFRLAERKIDDLLNIKSNFTEIRKKCSSILTDPTIDEIYVKYQECSKFSKEIIEKIKDLEIQTDIDFLTTRNEVVKLLKFALKNKEVYLVSDMYYTADVLQKILLKCGLKVKKENIIVSCEHKKSKFDSSLWLYYREQILGNKTALHIGDNIKSDVDNPKIYSIDTFYVMNTRDMLENSSLNRVLPKIQSIYSSLAMGLICERLFNNPFMLNKTKGIVRFRDETDTGFVLFGAICYSFFVWLFEQAEKEGIDTLVFFSREGFFLTRLASFFQKKIGGKKKIIYLDISRRAIMAAATKSKNDIQEILRFPYKGTTTNFLLDRFNIKKDVDNLSLSEAVEKFEKEILTRTSIERKGYLKYFEKKLSDAGKYAVIDSWFYGTTQFFLGKLLNKRLDGFYFCADKSDSNICSKFQNMEYCLPSNSYLYKNCLFAESFFTSPKGMLLYIDSLGIKHYGEKKSNQKKFNIRKKMTVGITDFLYNMIDIQKEFGLNENDTEFSDALFGICMDKGFSPSEEMKTSFFYDNGIANRLENPIFE